MIRCRVELKILSQILDRDLALAAIRKIISDAQYMHWFRGPLHPLDPTGLRQNRSTDYHHPKRLGFRSAHLGDTDFYGVEAKVVTAWQGLCLAAK